MRRRAAVIATALTVLLAGCAGGAGRAASDDAGDTLDFYVSDRPNDIDGFESPNVTIDRVGFRTANGSTVGYEVDDRTVDRIELRSANATLVGRFDPPSGEYETAFLYVAAVDDDPKEGSTRVKLPSGKPQVTTPFTIGENDSVDLVFDVTVERVGNSGKYILTPVVGESGTDVAIDTDTDGDGQDDRGADADETDGQDGDERSLEDAPGEDGDGDGDDTAAALVTVR